MAETRGYSDVRAREERDGVVVETGQDLTLCGEVGRIHDWIRHANEVLGIGEGDESAAPKPGTLVGQIAECVNYLNDPLSVRLEAILKELHRLKELVG